MFIRTPPESNYDIVGILLNLITGKMNGIRIIDLRKKIKIFGAISGIFRLNGIIVIRFLVLLVLCMRWRFLQDLFLFYGIKFVNPIQFNMCIIL